LSARFSAASRSFSRRISACSRSFSRRASSRSFSLSWRSRSFSALSISWRHWSSRRWASSRIISTMMAMSLLSLRTGGVSAALRRLRFSSYMRSVISFWAPITSRTTDRFESSAFSFSFLASAALLGKIGSPTILMVLLALMTLVPDPGRFGPKIVTR
jgi:hypothetical protein